MGKIGPAPLLGLALGVSFSRVKVAPGQQVLQVDVPLRLVLLHQDHGIGLTEERPGGSELTKLDELDADLLVKVDELLLRQLERLDGPQHGVPVAAVDVGHEGVLRVDSVERDGGLLLQALQGPVEVVLFQVLLDQTHDVGGLDLDRHRLRLLRFLSFRPGIRIVQNSARSW